MVVFVAAHMDIESRYGALGGPDGGQHRGNCGDIRRMRVLVKHVRDNHQKEGVVGRSGVEGHSFGI